VHGVGGAEFDPALAKKNKSQVFSSFEDRIILGTRQLRVNQIRLAEADAQLAADVRLKYCGGQYRLRPVGVDASAISRGHSNAPLVASAAPVQWGTRADDG